MSVFVRQPILTRPATVPVRTFLDQPTPNLLLTTLATPAAAASPFVPVMWDNPISPWLAAIVDQPINLTLTLYVPPESMPFRFNEFPNPILPIWSPNIGHFEVNFMPLGHPPVTPFGDRARNAPLVARVPDLDPRIRRFTEFVSSVMNSLFRQGYIVQTGANPLEFAFGRSAATATGSSPIATSDDEHGFSVGDTWVDTATQHVYIAVDVTTGAAVWKRID